ncbi:unnamed protein product [Acanthoscelides obtectus]|uniref:ENT domain-containing protein n=1 Tax=Acanthoscelides obtectus TaxID=200917 RepID=A0A9P0LGL9_ACAOB|nr:unnamed protein product [Acanthoscelides obtectus]CAK1663090.1 BRCA2-interacting transcriptional repressor EMSY [Acanthoscelides obtectus]
MWPVLLDMTKEESIQNLRNIELEAYSHLVSALRAQGPLTSDKRKLLKETGYLLNITEERHKAEVRRAISDEKLNTIAYHVTGNTETVDDWAQEGRRLVPLLPRTAPQTALSALADETAEVASQCNKQLPAPNNTERRRLPVVTGQPQQSHPPTTAASTSEASGVGSSKSAMQFRIPEPPKPEDKKRKLVQDTGNLAQQLISPRLCRIQNLYRQRSKSKSREIHKKPDPEHLELYEQHLIPGVQTIPVSQSQFVHQKVNVLQNITLQPMKEDDVDKEPGMYQQQRCSNENHSPQKVFINANNLSAAMKSGALPSGELKQIKMSSAKVIPLSQLQMLSSKGSIKVLPLGGKIVGKGLTSLSPSAQSLYLMNTSPKLVKASPKVPSLEIKTDQTEDDSTSRNSNIRGNNSNLQNKTIVTMPRQETFDINKREEFHITETRPEVENVKQATEREEDKTKVIVVKNEVVMDDINDRLLGNIDISLNETIDDETDITLEDGIEIGHMEEYVENVELSEVDGVVHKMDYSSDIAHD